MRVYLSDPHFGYEPEIADVPDENVIIGGGDIMEPRPIYEIAIDIRRDWKHPYFGAVPYLDAMCSLDRITDDYGADSGKSVVMYFLSNAATWRGDVARRIKAELNALLKAN